LHDYTIESPNQLCKNDEFILENVSMKNNLLISVMAVSVLAGCAATNPNYQAPNIKPNEPAIVITGTNQTSACFGTILIDGTYAADVGPYETISIPVQPGRHFVRWDIEKKGSCLGHRQDIAHKMVEVHDGPIMLKLDISGIGKAFIPIYGIFTSPEFSIIEIN